MSFQLLIYILLFQSFSLSLSLSDFIFFFQCYYLGGAEDSATKILSKMSKPLSWSKPVDKVCEDLRKMDEQICDLRYEVQVDISNVDLRTLRVRELRKILSSWNQKCDGCIEKEEFIQRIEELKPKYAPEATAAKEEL